MHGAMGVSRSPRQSEIRIKIKCIAIFCKSTAGVPKGLIGGGKLVDDGRRGVACVAAVRIEFLQFVWFACREADVGNNNGVKEGLVAFAHVKYEEVPGPVVPRSATHGEGRCMAEPAMREEFGASSPCGRFT